MKVAEVQKKEVQLEVGNMCLSCLLHTSNREASLMTEDAVQLN